MGLESYPRLKSVHNRKFNCQRAECQDPEVVKKWFKTILEVDIYSFDESRFQMGIISTSRLSQV